MPVQIQERISGKRREINSEWTTVTNRRAKRQNSQHYSDQRSRRPSRQPTSRQRDKVPAASVDILEVPSDCFREVFYLECRAKYNRNLRFRDNENALYETVTRMMYEATASHPEIDLLETIEVRTNMNHSLPLDTIRVKFVVCDEHTAEVLEQVFTEAYPVRTDTHDLIRFKWLNRPQVLQYRMCNVPCSMNPTNLLHALQEKYRFKFRSGSYSLQIRSDHPLPATTYLGAGFTNPAVIHFYPDKPSKPFKDLRRQDRIAQEQKERQEKLSALKATPKKVQNIKETQTQKPKEVSLTEQSGHDSNIILSPTSADLCATEQENLSPNKQAATQEPTAGHDSSSVDNTEEAAKQQATNKSNQTTETVQNEEQPHKEDTTADSPLHPYVTVRQGRYPSPTCRLHAKSTTTTTTTNPLFLEHEEGVTSSQETIRFGPKPSQSRTDKHLLDQVPVIQDWATLDHGHSTWVDVVMYGSPTQDINQY